jgi:hypothetical protein
LGAVKSRCPAALFALRKGDYKTVREYLAAATIQSVLRSVGMKEEPEVVAAKLAE